jgi:hypothetical protein
MMLGRWNAKKSLGQQYHAPLKDFLLCRIAFEMHKTGKTSLKLDEFKRRVEEELRKRGHDAEVGQLTDELLLRSGLLRCSDDSVEFRHMLLQEFFAGRGIMSREAVPFLAVNDWWSRSLVFYFGQNPGDAGLFALVQNKLVNASLVEAFFGARTMGLALQACYLVETKEKLEIYPWVVETLSNAKSGFLSAVDPNNKRPLVRFIDYYLAVRDSVAGSFVKDNYTELKAALIGKGIATTDADIRRFWLIIALLESGAIDEASKEVEDFNPADLRLLLAIHLSCFLVSQLRIAAHPDKEAARAIVKVVAPRIAWLRKDLLAEWRTELLEIRQGQIQAVEQPPGS